MLPENFRRQLMDKALDLLNDAEQMFAAAHTLGYLKPAQAVTPLLTHLEATEWSDWVALMALLQIGTEEAFDALETALGEIGVRLSLSDQQAGTDNQEEVRQTRNELYGALSEVRVRGFQHCPLDKIVPFLTRLLEHPNYYVRSEAIQSLGHLGACETALAIVQSVRHSAGWSSMDIRQALHEFGAQIAVEPILTLVNDPTTLDTVLSVAIEALGVSRDERVLEPLSRSITQRRFLFEVIQALGNTRLPGAIPLLVQILQDKTIISTNQGLLTREHLENMAIENLGKLQHPDAFEPVERFTRTNLPKVWHASVIALAASDGERALPLLQELWELDPEMRKTILGAFLWIGSDSATNKILDLLSPFDGAKAEMLASTLGYGRGLDSIFGTKFHIGVFEQTDDRLVALIDSYFDEMHPESMLRALFAMEYIATPPARQLLERIASNAKYDIPRPGVQPGSCSQKLCTHLDIDRPLC
jgi:HEAT repeat protein